MTQERLWTLRFQDKSKIWPPRTFNCITFLLFNYPCRIPLEGFEMHNSGKWRAEVGKDAPHWSAIGLGLDDKNEFELLIE